MPTLSNTIVIRRPIEDVFRVLTSVENAGKWFPANVTEEWTSAPPHGIGSTRHAVIRMLGRRTENDAVVTAYEPPHRAEMSGTTPNAPFVTALTFERQADGTAVRVQTELTWHGMQRLVGPLFASWYGRAWDRGLVNVKRMMESGEL